MRAGTVKLQNDKKSTVKVVHMNHALYFQSSDDIMKRNILKLHPSSLFMSIHERNSDLRTSFFDSNLFKESVPVPTTSQ